ncbi:MAG TPA: D-alanine--D-alanine ligase family protein [Pseudonocardiaceae bacterium]
MPEPRIRLAVLFGGRSGEHDVSCQSAAGILAGLDRDRYDILPVRIGRDGVWASVPAMPDLRTVEEVLRWQRHGFPGPGDATPAGSILAVARELTSCDVVFPALHGPHGEDGAVQAMLEGFGVPYVGNGVAAGALGMDKEYTKKIAVSAGLTVADGVVLRAGQDDVSPGDRDRLGLPVFVKPAREGSSIGVSKVRDWADLPQAIGRARTSDQKILVEAAVPGREIDIGVLEHPGGHLAVSPPMEILPSTEHPFFDHHAKYADSATVFDVPAGLDPATTRAIGQDALRLFRELGCSGLLRVDFFLRPDGTRILNEVNTFPGFTGVSQYPRMWQAAGLGYGALLDVLVDTALTASRRRRPPGPRRRRAPTTGRSRAGAPGSGAGRTPV